MRGRCGIGEEGMIIGTVFIIVVEVEVEGIKSVMDSEKVVESCTSSDNLRLDIVAALGS